MWHTIQISEHSADGQTDAPPDVHVAGVAVLHERLPLVVAPVHVARDEVRHVVVAPDEHRVHLQAVNIIRDMFMALCD